MGDKQCRVCGKPACHKKCSQCKAVFYCSREHQFLDWKSHRKTCQAPELIGSEYNPEHKFLNYGMCSFGWEFFFACFDAICSHAKRKDMPIIDMGSGIGRVLKKLKSVYPQAIGIDNYAEEYIGSVEDCDGEKASFATIQDYLKKKKISHSPTDDHTILLLNWPSPNYSTYDFDSLTLLKPAWCIIIMEATGGTCGFKFLSLLKSFGLNSMDPYMQIPAYPFSESMKYKVVHTTTRLGSIRGEELCYQMVILSRVTDRLSVRAPEQIHRRFLRPLNEAEELELDKMVAKNHGVSVDQVQAERKFRRKYTSHIRPKIPILDCVSK